MSLSLSQVPSEIRIGGGTRSYLSVAGALVFVVFGVALIFSPHAGLTQRLVGAGEVLVFGPMPVYWALRLRRAGCLYVLAADGMRFPMHEWPTVPWSDVEGSRIARRHSRRYLAIDVRNAETRVRAMRRGSRAARWNLRHGLGLVVIAEQIAPIPLEALQDEIVRRVAGAASSSVPVTGSFSARAVLPMAVPARLSPSGARSLRLVAALHGVTMLLAATGRHHSTTYRELAVVVGAALVVGARLLSKSAAAVGLCLVVATEALLMVVDLTAGQHIAVATRILYLFMPIAVLLLAAQTWSQRNTYKP